MWRIGICAILEPLGKDHCKSRDQSASSPSQATGGRSTWLTPSPPSASRSAETTAFKCVCTGARACVNLLPCDWTAGLLFYTHQLHRPLRSRSGESDQNGNASLTRGPLKSLFWALSSFCRGLLHRLLRWRPFIHLGRANRNSSPSVTQPRPATPHLWCQDSVGCVRLRKAFHSFNKELLSTSFFQILCQQRGQEGTHRAGLLGGFGAKTEQLLKQTPGLVPL